MRLYCWTPFGKLHNRNPEIVRLAQLIGRTPNALGMKACNFASLDPAQRARGIKGLSARSKTDERLWQEFEQNAEAVAAEAEAAYERFTDDATRADDQRRAVGVSPRSPQRETDQAAKTANAAAPRWADAHRSPTEVEQTIRARRVQRFFRQAVLISYDTRCALTGLAVPELLNASHIIPWAENEQRRANPRNGLCLNALHDRAFDRGLLTFDEDLRAVVSPVLKTKDPPVLHAEFLLGIEGTRIQLPGRFEPDGAALAWHRGNVFWRGVSPHDPIFVCELTAGQIGRVIAALHAYTHPLGSSDAPRKDQDSELPVVQR